MLQLLFHNSESLITSQRCSVPNLSDEYSNQWLGRLELVSDIGDVVCPVILRCEFSENYRVSRDLRNGGSIHDDPWRFRKRQEIRWGAINVFESSYLGFKHELRLGLFILSAILFFFVLMNYVGYFTACGVLGCIRGVCVTSQLTYLSLPRL